MSTSKIDILTQTTVFQLEPRPTCIISTNNPRSAVGMSFAPAITGRQFMQAPATELIVGTLKYLGPEHRKADGTPALIVVNKETK